MIDKRRWPRVSCGWEAMVSSITRDNNRPRTAVTIDLSEGGVRFRSDHFIAVGDRLRFSLRPPKGPIMDVVLSSVWVREIPTLSTFEVGGSFQDVSREGQRLLRTWTDASQAVLVTRTSEAVF